MTQMLRFMRAQAALLISALSQPLEHVERHLSPVTELIAEGPTVTLCNLPEYLVEDVFEFIHLYCNSMPGQVVASMDVSVANDFVTLAVLICGSPSRVYNPYIRAGAVEALLRFVPSRSTALRQDLQHLAELGGIAGQLTASPPLCRKLPPLYSCLLQHQFAQQHLPAALCTLFVDIEFTGM